MGQKGFDLRLAHVARVAFAVVQDVAPNPVDVGIFGPVAIVERPQTVADLLEQPGRLGGSAG